MNNNKLKRKRKKGGMKVKKRTKKSNQTKFKNSPIELNVGSVVKLNPRLGLI